MSSAPRLYSFKRKPYVHQTRALKFALRKKRAALLMQQRTGKTKVAIDWMSALSEAGRLDRAVIVAPARVLDVWVQAFHDDCPVRYHLHIWDADARTKTVTIPAKKALVRVDGVTRQVEIPAEKKRIVKDPPKVTGSHDLSVVLVNYEAFSTGGQKLPSGTVSKRTGRFAHRTAIERWLEGKPAAIVLDESHKIKSPSSKAATMLVSMRDYFDYRLILTGTPITKAKRVFDVYMQWKFLNPSRFAEWKTADEFKAHFGVWFQHPAGYMEFSRPKNTDELNKRIYEDSYRVTRDECFDLPPKTVVVKKIELGQKAGEAYDELAKEMVAQIEHEDKTHIVEASIALVLALRLTQITGGFAKPSGGVREASGPALIAPDRADISRVVDTNPSGMGANAEPESSRATSAIPVGTEKLDALEGLLEEAQENEEKMVVAARFRPEMDAIVALARKLKLPVYEVRGGLSRSVVTDNIRSFKEAEGAAVIVIQPQAGGVGIDLSTASHMVWYSLTPSWVDYTQACDRIALSAKATTYTYLLASKTVDELLYATLQEDGDIAETILKDPRKVLRT